MTPPTHCSAPLAFGRSPSQHMVLKLHVLIYNDLSDAFLSHQSQDKSDLFNAIYPLTQTTQDKR